jgi:formylglycine-generating enzyme required for sulfatase activity/tetratricopeptide (TPR) repeat protein
MSYYVWGSQLSYKDYLQTKNFVSDVSSATRNAGRAVSMEISRQTREVIASNEAMARDNIRAIESNTDAINTGFDRLSYGIDNISSGISDLNATFHWGFGEAIASLGHMNDALSELIKIAKSPIQTVAFNHFEIARDAYRQGLYQEALDELEKAIAGDHTSAGYKLEWRFHQMKGTLQLGFVGADMSLVDLAKAEASFLQAARYGKSDYPEDAGRAFLSAGWAAYCQGNMKEALAHTEQAIVLNPRMGEGFFQAAKVQMALGQVDTALPLLAKAIDLDQFYSLKAAGDGDFQKYDEQLRRFLEALRKEKYRQSVTMVKAALDKIRLWVENAEAAKNHEAVKRMQLFIQQGSNWPLLDIFHVMHGLGQTISAIEQGARGSLFIVSRKTPGAQRTRVETYQAEETREEEVVLKPGSLFRKAVTERRMKTLTVIKKRDVTYNLDAITVEIYKGISDFVATIEFCPIPTGTFTMGEGNERHQVLLTKDFHLGKYPVTQAQWQTIMGNNPSSFKGDLSYPIESVSWDDCQAFIQKLNSLSGTQNYRLPTEAEWEFACRAGSTTSYCYGDDSPLGLDKYAWYEDNSGGTVHAVGQKKPNALGLYDMHGNVWEWCQDWCGYLSTSDATDPQGASSGQHRVLRGGSWKYIASSSCSSVARLRGAPGSRDNFIGFRLARNR